MHIILKEKELFFEFTINNKFKSIFTKACANNFSLYHRNIKPTKTINNWEKLSKTLNLNLNNIFVSHLEHKDNFFLIQNQNLFKFENQNNKYNNTFFSNIKNHKFSNLIKQDLLSDSIISFNTEKIPAITYADCIPISIIDTKMNIVCSVHSGWKGTLLQITPKILSHIIKNGSKQKDLVCIIGPSISQRNYEVQNDFLKTNEADYFNKNYNLASYIKNSNNKLFYDNRKALIDSLSQFKKINIYDFNIDTYSDSRMSSYRKDKSKFKAQALLTYCS